MDEDRQYKTRARAYDLWEAAGKPDGKHAYFWKMAEKEIAEADKPADDTPEPSHEPPI